jgi:hypothetical protein
MPSDGNGATAGFGTGFSGFRLSMDLAFTLPNLIAPHLTDDTIRALALTRISGAGPTEYNTSEQTAKADAAAFSMDLRRGVGSAGLVEAGADDDLVEALLASISELHQAMAQELLSGVDFAAGLLTGLPPNADILPPKGPRAAAVGTLVAGEVGDETVARPGGDADELLLKVFLIDPVLKPVDTPAAIKTTPDATAGEQETMADSAREQLAIPAAVGLASGPLLVCAVSPTKRSAMRQRRRASRRKTRRSRNASANEHSRLL